MENRIKEQQLDLFANRTSCHHRWLNQFRLLLSSLAYILLEVIRRLALQDAELARVYVGTLRLKLIKIGAVILRNTRRIRFLLLSSCPNQKQFFHVATKLAIPRFSAYGAALCLSLGRSFIFAITCTEKDKKHYKT